MSIPNSAASVPTNLSLVNELVENSVPTAETPLFAEHYRQIFVSLDLPDEPGSVIGITSAIGLDLPPLLNNSYSAIAASAVDALVLVIRAGATPAEVVSEAIARSRVVPQGVVLNGQQTARPAWPSGRR